MYYKIIHPSIPRISSTIRRKAKNHAYKMKTKVTVVPLAYLSDFGLLTDRLIGDKTFTSIKIIPSFRLSSSVYDHTTDRHISAKINLSEKHHGK